MGTSIAFIKYLSEHRVKDPKKRYPVWAGFRLVAGPFGAVQVALVSPLPAHWRRVSAYACMLEHNYPFLYPDPRFLSGHENALTGFQRLDYSRVLEVGTQRCFTNSGQPVFVTSCTHGAKPIRSLEERWAFAWYGLGCLCRRIDHLSPRTVVL